MGAAAGVEGGENIREADRLETFVGDRYPRRARREGLPVHAWQEGLPARANSLSNDGWAPGAFGPCVDIIFAFRMLPVTLQAGTDIAPGRLDHAAGPASTRRYEE